MPLKRLYWITSDKHDGGYVHERPVHALLRARGFEVAPIVWDRDPIPRLGGDDRVIVRTPWDYLAKYAKFLEWIDGLPAGRTHNSANVLRWNSEKGYLAELEGAGVALVPTVWIRAESERDFLGAARAAFPGRARIAKRALSAGSVDTFRLAPDEAPPADRFVGRATMIQPYLAEIETDGERSLVYFSGRFSHAVRKRPKAGDFRVQESFGGIFSAFAPDAGELRFGDAAMAAIRARFPAEPAPLYARIDYVVVDGRPLLMEAELLEPDLYLHHAPGAAERFADAVAAL